MGFLCMREEKDITQPELEQFKAQSKQEYEKLLNLLALVMRASSPLSTTDVEDRERLSMALGLSNKFIEQAATILYLCNGTKVSLPSYIFSFLDSSSIDILTRAAMHTFLVFHHVFYAPATAEEKDYRYWAYMAAGIAERQNSPATTEESRQKLDNEKIELDKLHNKLRSNTVFQGLSEKQKKQILKGQWKLQSWHDIAIDAGISKKIALHLHSLLSGHVHSSSLSVVQAVEAHIAGEDEKAISSSIATLNIVIANMIREYCALFSKAYAALTKDTEGNDLINYWIQIGQGLDKFAI